MTRYHGITDKTYSRILIDAGQLRIGYVDESNPGALLGATRGGSVFAIEPDIRLMPVDGAKGDVKGDKRIARVNATITANVIELSAWVLALSLPGSTTDNYPDVTPTHNQIRRYLALAISKYRSTIALIGEIAGTGEPIVCILSNVIGTKGMSLALAENDEATLQMVFTAHFDPATMDAEPWEIRNPQEAAGKPLSDFSWLWKGYHPATVDASLLSALSFFDDSVGSIVSWSWQVLNCITDTYDELSTDQNPTLNIGSDYLGEYVTDLGFPVNVRLIVSDGLSNSTKDYSFYAATPD